MNIDLDQCKELIFKGWKLQAIKLYFDQSGGTLQEAKSHMDALELDLKKEFPEKFKRPPMPPLELREKEYISDKDELYTALSALPEPWEITEFGPGCMGWIAEIKFLDLKIRLHTHKGELGWNYPKQIDIPYPDTFTHFGLIREILTKVMEINKSQPAG